MKHLNTSSLSTALLSISLLAVNAPAIADDRSWILNARLRAEHVQQDGLQDAAALTLRARIGYDYKLSDHFSVLGEIEGVAHLNSDFSDTVDNIPGKAVVADPEALEINRLQIAWKDGKSNAAIGRQRIILDNARFVGNVGFRQNEQTFDAFRLGHELTDGVTAEYVYIDRVHRIFGDDHPAGEWDSDSHVFRAAAKTAFGDITAYGLLLDFDNATAASGQTWGASWSKKHEAELGTIGLKAEAAIQRDWRGAGPQSTLGYQSAALSLKRGKITGYAEIDVLEGSGGRGFTTPLATLHAFQGWADVFLTTPASGLRDIHAGLNGSLPAALKDAKPVGWAVRYHVFSSDSGQTDLGTELNALLKVPLTPKFAVEGKLAHFNGDTDGPADRTKIWLSLNADF